jgi:hypothetical protein
MAGFVQSVIDSQLSWISGSTFTAAPGSTYIGLLTHLPNAAGSGAVEAPQTTRQSVTWSAPATDGGGHRFIQNSGSLTFTFSGACTVVGFAVFDALTNGNLLYYSSLPLRAVQNPDSLTTTLQAGAVQIYTTRGN